MTDRNLLIGNKKTAKRQFSNAMRKKIDAVIVRHVFQQGYIGQLTAFFCATLLFFGLYVGHQDKKLLVSWYLASLAVVLYRTIVIAIYLRQPDADKRVKFWKKVFIAHAFLGGLVWGVMGGVLFPHFPMEQQLLIILIVAGVAAGSTPILSAIMLASFAFLIPTLLPLVGQLLLLCHDNTYSAVSLIVIVYFLYLIAISFRTNRMVLNAIELQFENESLVTHLSKAKSELEDSNKKLAEAASHDPLTGVANRKLFHEYFTLALKRAELTQAIIMVMYIDLDNFKFVNDTYGHHVGDQLLIDFIKLLETNIQSTGFIGRLGGDELAVIIENMTDLEQVNQIASALCQAIDKNVTIGKHTIHISASIGVSLYPADGSTVEALLKLADRAMYYIKGHGRNSFYLAGKLPKDEETVKRPDRPGSRYIL